MDEADTQPNKEKRAKAIREAIDSYVLKVPRAILLRKRLLSAKKVQKTR